MGHWPTLQHENRVPKGRFSEQSLFSVMARLARGSSLGTCLVTDCSDKCRATRWRRQGEAAQRAEVESIGLAVRMLRAGAGALKLTRMLAICANTSLRSSPLC